MGAGDHVGGDWARKRKLEKARACPGSGKKTGGIARSKRKAGAVLVEADRGATAGSCGMDRGGKREAGRWADDDGFGGGTGRQHGQGRSNAGCDHARQRNAGTITDAAREIQRSAGGI